MRLDDPADVVVVVGGKSTRFPSLRQGLLFVWDNMDEVQRVKCDGVRIKVGEEIWKR